MGFWGWALAVLGGGMALAVGIGVWACFATSAMLDRLEEMDCNAGDDDV